MTERILLTGATGLIGRQVLQMLSKQGLEVHAITTRRRAWQQRTGAADWHEADLLAEGVPSRIISRVKPSGLMHLAWSVSPGTSGSVIHREWLRASKVLIREFYERGGKRALVAGSCFEYDWSNGVCSERDTLKKPNSEYGKCKASLCKYTENFCRNENFSWAWGRIFFVYGPYEHPARFVSSVILSLLKNQTARCTHGRQVRDYLHSRDVASGLIRLFDSGFDGECNIGSGRPVTLRKMGECIAEILGAEHLLDFGAIPVPKDEPPMIVADLERLTGKVRWQPQIELREGLAETIAAWRRDLDASPDRK